MVFGFWCQPKKIIAVTIENYKEAHSQHKFERKILHENDALINIIVSCECKRCFEKKVTLALR